MIFIILHCKTCLCVTSFVLLQTSISYYSYKTITQAQWHTTTNINVSHFCRVQQIWVGWLCWSLLDSSQMGFCLGWAHLGQFIWETLLHLSLILEGRDFVLFITLPGFELLNQRAQWNSYLILCILKRSTKLKPMVPLLFPNPSTYTYLRKQNTSSLILISIHFCFYMPLFFHYSHDCNVRHSHFLWPLSRTFKYWVVFYPQGNSDLFAFSGDIGRKITLMV